MLRRHTPKFIILAISILVIAACTGSPNTDELTASGTISAASIDVSSELGGRIEEIFIEAGTIVNEGDPLFRLDDEILIAQQAQAEAAVSAAEAGLSTAQEQRSAAQLQVELALQGARYNELQLANLEAQAMPWPEDFNLPEWYFNQIEDIGGIDQEIIDSEEWLSTEIANLEELQGDIKNTSFISLETDLAKAQHTYLIAQQNLFKFSQPGNSETLTDIAQEQFDAAQAELDSLQLEYERMLSESQIEEFLEARARVLIAQERLDTALLIQDSLLTGENSLLVKSAKANLALAESQIAQAEAGKEQAKAVLALLDIQLGKAMVYASMSGVVVSETIEKGQLIGPGMTALTIAQLADVELTVYVPEDRYGQISLGDSVEITADSFPGELFTGTVRRIADEAEFTPRNVQTVEGRKATVYAILINVPNPNLKLKSGMPVDVVFTN